MPIAVTCACGKTFKVKDELAGKKVKCPACQATVQVLEAESVVDVVEEDEPPPARSAKKAAPLEDDDFDDEPRRKDGKKKKKSGQQGSKTMLFVLLGGGVLLLGLCCIGGGIAGYVFFLASPGDPEKEIIGKWQYDGVFGNHTHMGTSPTLEFKEDGSFNMIDANPAVTYANGKWKQTSKKGTSMTVEVSYDLVHPGNIRFSRTETYYFIIPSHNVLQRKFSPAANGGLRYKRI